MVADPESSANPFIKLVKMWAAGSESYAELYERAGKLQSDLLHRSMNEMPEVVRARIDGQTLARLQMLMAANWQREVERIPRILPALAERFHQADPERMAPLFESMMAEYLADLQEMEDDAFQIDFGPLVGAWEKVLAGAADEVATKVVDRFMQALTVKARYGPEYYADPATPVGETPRTCVFEEGTARVYRYRLGEEDATRRGPPVLLVYSIINRPFILDLHPDHSFVRHLLRCGLDVHLMDWGEPAPGDAAATLDNYIDPVLRRCVSAVREQTDADRVSLFGHCIGGNLALMYTALFPEDVGRLLTLTTPATAAAGGVVGLWTDRDVFPVDAIIDAYGVMPAKLIRYTFLALKPYFEVIKWKKFLENLEDDGVMALFCAIDRWANENVDVAGEVFRKFVVEVFHADRFCRNQTRIHDRPVDLTTISCPYLNLSANRDWIVPLDSARILGDLVGSSDKRFIEIEGAHVSIMIDPKLRPLWDEMSAFLIA